MKYVKQFGIIIVITFIGEVLHDVLPFPIPASIYGLLLLFTALETKFFKLEDVEDTAKFLIEIMPIMFIPSAVGLIDAWGTLKNIWIQVVIITLLSTIIVMVVSGKVTQWVIRKTQGNKEKSQEMCDDRQKDKDINRNHIMEDDSENNGGMR